MIGYLDEDIRTLVLIMPKMSGYVKAFKVEDKLSKLLSFRIDYEKVFEKYKAIWTNIKDLKNIKLNALPVYGDRYITTKIRTYGDKVYTNFRGLDVPKDDSLRVHKNKYYLQVYLDNCAYRIGNKQMTDYKIFED